MNLKCQTEVENTRRKLQALEESCERIQQDEELSEPVREASLESIVRLINQFKEEIARFEARTNSGREVA